jgi:hypothetical protein
MKTFLATSSLLRVLSLFAVLSLPYVPKAQTQCICLIPDKNETVCGRPIINVEAALAERANAFAKLKEAQAHRAAALAQLQLTSVSLERITTLAEAGAVSQQQRDTARRDRDVAQAGLAAADQKIQAAKANLERATAVLRQLQANPKQE